MRHQNSVLPTNTSHTLLSVFLHGKRIHIPRVTMQATYRPAEGLKPQQPGATATEVNCANGHSGGAKANVSSKAIASHTDFANDNSKCGQTDKARTLGRGAPASAMQLPNHSYATNKGAQCGLCYAKCAFTLQAIGAPGTPVLPPACVNGSASSETVVSSSCEQHNLSIICSRSPQVREHQVVLFPCYIARREHQVSAWTCASPSLQTDLARSTYATRSNCSRGEHDFNS